MLVWMLSSSLTWVCWSQLKQKGLRVQAVMSFHAAGNNVGDICHIPLPSFVLEVGRQNPDIFYRDREGRVNEECLSLGCDDEPLFSNNETPIMKYQKFMKAFVQEFEELIGAAGLHVSVLGGRGARARMRVCVCVCVCVSVCVCAVRLLSYCLFGSVSMVSLVLNRDRLGQDCAE
jgi:hypothetical protein